MPNPTLERGMLVLIKKDALYDAVTSTQLWGNAAGLEDHPCLWHIPLRLCAFLEKCSDRVAAASSGQLLVADRVLKEELVKVAVLEEGRPEARGTVMGADADGLLWVQIDDETEARLLKVEDVFDVSAAPLWFHRASNQFGAFCRGEAVQVTGSGVLGTFETVLMIPGEPAPSVLVRLFVADNDTFIPRHLRPFLPLLGLNRVTVCSIDLLMKCELLIVKVPFGVDDIQVPRGCLVAINTDNDVWTVDLLMLIGRFREVPSQMRKDTCKISVQQLQRLLPIPAQDRLVSLEACDFQNEDNVGLQRQRSSGRKPKKEDDNEAPPSWITRAFSSDDEVSGFKRGQLVEVEVQSSTCFGFVKAVLRPPLENSAFLVAESFTPLRIENPIPASLQPFLVHLPLPCNRTLACNLQNAKHCTPYLLTKTHVSGIAAGTLLIQNRDGNLRTFDTGNSLGFCLDLRGTFSVDEVQLEALPFLLPVQPFAIRVALHKSGHVKRLLGSPLPLPNVLLWPRNGRKQAALGTVTRFEDGHAWIRVGDEKIRTSLNELFRLDDSLAFATNERSKKQLLPGDLVSEEGGQLIGRLRAILRIPWVPRPVGVVILTTQGVAGDVNVYSISDLKFIARDVEEIPVNRPRSHDPPQVPATLPSRLASTAAPNSEAHSVPGFHAPPDPGDPPPDPPRSSLQVRPNVNPSGDSLPKEALLPKGADGDQTFSGCKKRPASEPGQAASNEDVAGVEDQNGSVLSPTCPDAATVAALPEWQGNIAWIFSSERGIYGHPGSSAVDALLFSVFAFSHVVERHVLRAQLPEVGQRARSLLFDRIVYPLRRDNEAPCEGVEALIEMMDQVDLVGRPRKRDLLENAVVLFETLLGLEPFLRVGSGSLSKGSFFLQLTAPEQPDLVSSSRCLEFSVLQNDLLFEKVPDVLMLVLPQNSSNTVVPSKMLDLRLCLQGARGLARCALCGAAPVEVWDRRLFSRGGMRAALLCAACCGWLPKDQLHPLPPDTGPPSAAGASELLLTAAICRRADSHTAFVRARQGASSAWLHFDSMADREDETFYPDITQASVEAWLSRVFATGKIDSDFCEEQKKPLHQLLFSAAHVLIYERENTE